MAFSKTKKYHSLSLVLTVLIIQFLHGCTSVTHAGYQDLQENENLYVGRAFFLDDVQLAKGKDKTFMQALGVDAWFVKDYTLCFDDGRPEKICQKFSAYLTALSKHKNNSNALLTFKSPAKSITLDSIFVESAGHSSYLYTFEKPPKITTQDKTNQAFYIGDFVLYLEGSKKKDDYPKLVFKTINKMKDTGKIFAHETRLKGQVSVMANPFILSDTKYTVKKTERIYTPTYMYIPK